jgi:hypothetical protein
MRPASLQNVHAAPLADILLRGHPRVAVAAPQVSTRLFLELENVLHAPLVDTTD